MRINPKYYRLLGWPETEKVNEEENVEKESEKAVSLQSEEVAEKVMTEECAIQIEENAEYAEESPA